METKPKAKGLFEKLTRDKLEIKRQKMKPCGVYFRYFRLLCSFRIIYLKRFTTNDWRPKKPKKRNSKRRITQKLAQHEPFFSFSWFFFFIYFSNQTMNFQVFFGPLFLFCVCVYVLCSILILIMPFVTHCLLKQHSSYPSLSLLSVTKQPHWAQTRHTHTST